MKKITAILLIVLFSLSLAGCYTNNHIVGEGAQSNQTVEAKQWYVLWGLVPINEVDSKELAGDSENYTITTQHTFVDVVISIFTGIVTVAPRTVQVTK